MKRLNAKELGYKVIDEFGDDISLITFVVIENGRENVYDEFDINITKIVKIIK